MGRPLEFEAIMTYRVNSRTGLHREVLLKKQKQKTKPKQKGWMELVVRNGGAYL